MFPQASKPASITNLYLAQVIIKICIASQLIHNIKKYRCYVACYLAILLLFDVDPASEPPYLLLRIRKSTLGNKHFSKNPLARSNDVSDPMT